MKKFVCKVCGYIYEGDAAPAECPVMISEDGRLLGTVQLALEGFWSVSDTVSRKDAP